MGQVGDRHRVRVGARHFEPRAAAWDGLAQVAPLYAQAGRTLLFGVSVVDRTEDARPAGAESGWDTLANRGASEALVDRVWQTFGSELGYLVIGRDPERKLRLQSFRFDGDAFSDEPICYNDEGMGRDPVPRGQA